MLMLMVAIVGMGLAYLLLAKVLSEQSSKIRTQSEEISAYSQENQEKATRIAELMRELDKQRANLTEIEKRLSETVVKLPEPEIRAAELKNPVPKSATARTGQPSQSSTFTSPIPAKSGNCDLLVGEKSAEELKRCIDNYNRK